MRWIINLCALIVGLLASTIFAVYLVIEVKKEQEKKEKIAVMQQGIEQLAAFQKTGFSLHDDRIKSIQEDIIQAHNDLKALELRLNFMSFVHVNKQTRKEMLGQFVEATKDMISQYTRNTKTSSDHLKC